MRFASLFPTRDSAGLTVRSQRLRLFAFLAALSFGCGGDNGRVLGPLVVQPPPPARGLGNVLVTTMTSGSDVDPDGYVVEVNGPWAYDHAPTEVASNATVTLRNLTRGSHTLALLGVSANCVGENLSARGIMVVPDSVIAVVFSLVCSATAR